MMSSTLVSATIGPVTNNMTTKGTLSELETEWEEVWNLVISFVDDMPIAYASAQLMVSGLTSIRIGESLCFENKDSYIMLYQ